MSNQSKTVLKTSFVDVLNEWTIRYSGFIKFWLCVNIKIDYDFSFKSANISQCLPSIVFIFFSRFKIIANNWVRFLEIKAQYKQNNMIVSRFFIEENLWHNRVIKNSWRHQIKSVNTRKRAASDE